MINEIIDTENKNPTKRGRHPATETPKLMWQEVETKYIYGEMFINKLGQKDIRFPTYRMLSEEFKVSETSIANRSSKGKWGLQRLNYQNKIRAKKFSEDLNHQWSYVAQENSRSIKDLDMINKILDAYFYKYKNLIDIAFDINEHDPQNHLNEIEKEKFNDCLENTAINVKELDTIMSLIEKKNKLLKSILEEEKDVEEFINEEIKNREIKRSTSIVSDYQEKEKKKRELLRQKKILEKEIENKKNQVLKFSIPKEGLA
jgi:hypothetical protein